MKKKSTLLLILLMLAVQIISCSRGNKTEVSIDTLSDGEYNSLSPENQYKVANTLLGTLYKGVTVKDFFDLSAGMSSMKVSGGANFMSKTQSTLNTPVKDRQTYIDQVDQKYYFDDEIQPQQYPLAMMFEFPLSRDYFDVWMAYTLATTILFSPAQELDSVDYADIQKVLYRLTFMIRTDASIRDIVYAHTTSQENWRRFRSPEDNTREMMEIYLLRFRDDEVPKAAKCCRNWHLTDGNQGYQLLIEYNENDEPQQILDTTVMGCYDFYRALANHGSLIPAITSRLVDRFFPNATPDEKSKIIQGITGSNPATFRQLFIAILFSKQYLLNTNRTKYFEETFFNVANRIFWVPDQAFFAYLNRPPDWWTGLETMAQMKQAPLNYKLGRRQVPLDSLSFAYYHKSVREELLVHRKSWDGDRGWQADLYNSVTLWGNDYIQYLFLSVLGRRADSGELAMLNQIFTTKGYTANTATNKRNIAMFVLDYCSRLSELYYQRSVQ
ncbi:MAG TPA: hypothetical protein VK654_16930 [Nitrospirota bacterium]|nr:hypothetical protein [Nitrospirota bacterium]